MSGPKHRAQHPEKLRAYEHAYRAARPEYERDRHHAWYERNREAKLAKGRADYAANREAKLAKNREWYQANKERHQANGRAWEKAHPEQIRFLRSKYNHTRRVLMGSVADRMTRDQWEAIKAAYRHCCAYCGRKMQRLEQDHVVPISKGGSLHASNVVPACRSCNSRKNNRAAPKPVQLVLT